MKPQVSREGNGTKPAITAPNRKWLSAIRLSTTPRSVVLFTKAFQLACIAAATRTRKMTVVCDMRYRRSAPAGAQRLTKSGNMRRRQTLRSGRHHDDTAAWLIRGPVSKRSIIVCASLCAGPIARVADISGAAF